MIGILVVRLDRCEIRNLINIRQAGLFFREDASRIRITPNIEKCRVDRIIRIIQIYREIDFSIRETEVIDKNRIIEINNVPRAYGSKEIYIFSDCSSANE